MTNPQEIAFDGIRLRYVSAKSYADVLAALLADIGEKPVLINHVSTTTGDWDSYQKQVEPRYGLQTMCEGEGWGTPPSSSD